MLFIIAPMIEMETIMFTYPLHAEFKRRHKQSLKTKTDNVVDPRRDSVLDPHQDESLWTGILQETVLVKESMGLGKEKALLIEEDVQVYASYVPSKQQINVLCQGLIQHNKEHEKAIKYSSDHVTVVLKYGEKSVAGIYGFAYKTVLTVVGFLLVEADQKLASMALKCMLDHLEPRIKTIYMSELPSDSWTVEALSALGFHIEETGNYSEINAWATVRELKITLKQYGHAPMGVSSVINRLEHYGQDFSGPENKGTKEFEASMKQFKLNFTKCFSEEAVQADLGCPKPPEVPSQLLDLDVPPISLDLVGHKPIEWGRIPVKHTAAVSGSFGHPKADQDEENEQAFEEIFKEINDRFMFIVQKEDKQIVGGVLCKVEEIQVHVEALWLHESMRGKKLSEKLVGLAEKHAKEKGCTDAGLETSSYQAPWLYPKLGYKQVSFLTMGPHAAYYYKKRL